MTEELVVLPEPEVRLGSLAIGGPDEMIARGAAVAKTLAGVINDRKLYTVISGRKFVRVEGWTTLGAMLGIVAREVSVTETNGDYEAVVELVRVSDGAVIGRGSALCGADERTWGQRDRYARRSMAITRACGKAFRLSLSWIITLAGYEPTPAEEMPEEEHAPRPAAPPKPEPPKVNGGAQKDASPTVDKDAKVKTAIVQTAEWQKGATALANRCPHYPNKLGNGPNYFHMLAAAAKLGFESVNDLNLGQVLNALEDYAAKREAEEKA